MKHGESDAAAYFHFFHDLPGDGESLWLDSFCLMSSDNLAGVMGYVTELDDLRSHIVYPPRGMEFAPARDLTRPRPSA